MISAWRGGVRLAASGELDYIRIHIFLYACIYTY
jgi:hypothetical protein